MTKIKKTLDNKLRPPVWDKYIGQTLLKNNLDILLGAAKERNQMPEHILLHGASGFGKTTLVHLIGKQLNVPIQTISGSMIKKTGDIISMVSTMEQGGILFIDEIHCLSKNIEEVLYPIMEDGNIDIIIGKGPTANPIKLKLQPITIIGATTQAGKLSTPLRNRFSGGVYKLTDYTEEELLQIVCNSATELGITISKAPALTIAKASRGVPRIANYLLKRVRDYCQIYKLDLTEDAVRQTLKNKAIDEYGLTKEDHKILETIYTVFNGGPVGINTLATIMNESIETVETVYEPFLIQAGLIERTNKGRILTKMGERYINKN